jgi:hypothetical protein
MPSGANAKLIFEPTAAASMTPATSVCTARPRGVADEARM